MSNCVIISLLEVFMNSERFRKERLRLKLTQEQLAKKLKTSRSNVANWENGQNNPSVDMLFKCSELFECSIAYLAGYSDSRNGDFNESNNCDPVFTQTDDVANYNELNQLFNKSNDALTDSEKEVIKAVMKNAIEIKKK